MAINTTRWSPDTCGCIVEYQWDGNDPPSLRNHILSRFIAKCADHAALTDNQAWSALTEENPRKNLALGEIVSRVSSLVQTRVDPDTGQDIVEWKPGMRPNWSFDKTTRVLQVSIPSLGAVAKNVLQTALDNRFGAGKVTVI